MKPDGIFWRVLRIFRKNLVPIRFPSQFSLNWYRVDNGWERWTLSQWTEKRKVRKMCFYPRVCVKVLYNLLVRLGGMCCNYLACVCRYNLPPATDCSSTHSSSSSSSSSNKEHIELNDNVYDYVVISEYCLQLAWCSFTVLSKFDGDESVATIGLFYWRFLAD